MVVSAAGVGTVMTVLMEGKEPDSAGQRPERERAPDARVPAMRIPADRDATHGCVRTAIDRGPLRGLRQLRIVDRRRRRRSGVAGAPDPLVDADRAA